MEEGYYYEGCGRDGPLRCIFLSEFHPVAGPKITLQVPENYISKETFDAISVYIIPKVPQLQKSIITVTLRDLKILGYPVRIDNKKYARNAFYFNLCFAFNAWARSIQYEPVLKKFSDYLIAMERENQFLSRTNQTESERSQMINMLRQVLKDLNTNNMCTLTGGTTTTHLRVVKQCKDPELVLDHQVPVFIEEANLFLSDQWDLTTRQVLPYIDGFNHVSRIAAIADVENALVKACIQNLMYYGVVKLIPLFQYSSVYTATPKLKDLAEDKALQDKCVKFVSKSAIHPPSLRDIFRMYSGMTYGTTIRDLCVRLNPHPLKINERKLVQFGIMEGLIRRIYKFPVYLSDEDSDSTVANDNQKQFIGMSSMDELCCSLGISNQQLEDKIERDPHTLFIWK